jgi:uncharacterized protein YndB with AHSA1/START domain
MDDSLENAVRKQILVAVPAERAFRVFAEGMDLWWPPAHHLGAAALKRVVLEPRAGGRWYEVGEDGAECQWGQVLVWEPPRRLVLAWQINGDWRYDPSLITEVAVTFHVESATTTRVELVHGNLDRFGEKREAARKAFESPEGWQLGLGRFAQAALAAQA